MSEASPLGMLTTDERGLIEYANPAFESIVGASAAHVHGRHWSDAVHPQDRQHALERWAAAQGGGTSMWAELRLLRPDRRVVWVRVTAAVMRADTVSRQGGDEFVILLAEIEHPADAAQVAEKLLAAFAEPQLIDGNELLVTLSIGISVFPDDDIDCLLQNADRAMYQAKNGGRNNYQFYAAAMSDRQAQ